MGNALPYLKAGKLKPLALMGTKRSPLLPDVPSLGEEGVDPGLSIYFCVFAPAKTPKPLVDRLNAEFVKALRSPKGQAMLEQDTLRREGNSPEEFARLMVEERANATRVFKTLGIRPNAANGARIHVAKGKMAVTDGPFAETKEVIGGFAILEVPTKEEAIRLGKEFMQIHVDVIGAAYDGALEVRPMFDPVNPGCS